MKTSSNFYCYSTRCYLYDQMLYSKKQLILATRWRSFLLSRCLLLLLLLCLYDGDLLLLRLLHLGLVRSFDRRKRGEFLDPDLAEPGPVVVRDAVRVCEELPVVMEPSHPCQAGLQGLPAPGPVRLRHRHPGEGGAVHRHGRPGEHVHRAVQGSGDRFSVSALIFMRQIETHFLDLQIAPEKLLFYPVVNGEGLGSRQNNTFRVLSFCVVGEKFLHLPCRSLPVPLGPEDEHRVVGLEPREGVSASVDISLGARPLLGGVETFLDRELRISLYKLIRWSEEWGIWKMVVDVLRMLIMRMIWATISIMIMATVMALNVLRPRMLIMGMIWATISIMIMATMMTLNVLRPRMLIMGMIWATISIMIMATM